MFAFFHFRFFEMIFYFYFCGCFLAFVLFFCSLIFLRKLFQVCFDLPWRMACLLVAHFGHKCPDFLWEKEDLVKISRGIYNWKKNLLVVCCCCCPCLPMNHCESAPTAVQQSLTKKDVWVAELWGKQLANHIPEFSSYLPWKPWILEELILTGFASSQRMSNWMELLCGLRWQKEFTSNWRVKMQSTSGHWLENVVAGKFWHHEKSLFLFLWCKCVVICCYL